MAMNNDLSAAEAPLYLEEGQGSHGPYSYFADHEPVSKREA